MKNTEKKAIEILEKAISELEKIHNNTAIKEIRKFDDTRRKIMSKDIDEERRTKIAGNVVKLEEKVIEVVEKIKAIGHQTIIHNY